MPAATSGDHPSPSGGSPTWESESSDFGTETRSCVAKSSCNAHLKSLLNVGVNIFLSVIGTLSAALGCSPRAPRRKPSTLSSPSSDRSGGHIPSLDAGRNQSSEISDGTHCWTQRATE